MARNGLSAATGLQWGLSRDDHYQLSNRFAWCWKLATLGIPVVLTAARQREGIEDLLKSITDVATGAIVCKPHRVQSLPPTVNKALDRLTAQVTAVVPGLPNARWVALRLLEGDQRMIDALQNGELSALASGIVSRAGISAAANSGKT